DYYCNSYAGINAFIF
nr:immunoglobulin light chain junction region [Macaca mulatta]MOW15151.1 immunoglobulin light chain junction region [Macaca mulatta]MOW16768.1 immunoglobulin light chain junction region [Macaca mulatta]MOW16946.1 immunoglobulin light chain junction region [Macaca mulatta]MOW17043.1 immunoglobulin light chain junction region [Macaca mulatta]